MAIANEAPAAPRADLSGSEPPFLSLIVPAYNEERRLAPTLERILAFLGQRPYTSEVIVVSDGSQDGTAHVARAALNGADLPPHVQGRFIEYQPNAGKGKAVRTGVLATRGRIVAFTDADLSTPIEEIDRALAFLERESAESEHRRQQYRLVIGSRAVVGASVEKYQPLYRRLSAQLFNLLRDSIVGIRGLRDTQCGLKVFHGSTARFIFERQRIDGFMFDVETMFIAQRLGLPIMEMGVRWADAPESKVKVSSGLRLLPDLLRIRFLHQGLSRSHLPTEARLNAVGL